VLGCGRLSSRPDPRHLARVLKRPAAVAELNS
jgi:hypothetical protein